MAPVGSVHNEAVPLEKRLFFHESVPAASCHVVETSPTLLEGAKSADVIPGEVE